MSRVGFVIFLYIISVLLALISGDAQAVPAFARREGIKCQMCHFRVPELNEDGRAYLRRGLREEPPGNETEMGVMERKAPTAANPRSLGLPLPLEWADYLTIMGHHEFMAEEGKRAAFHAGELDIWAGGPVDNKWSGLANPSLDIESGGAETEQAYGQYITQWSEVFSSGRFGQLRPFAILFNQGGPSMSLSTPVVLSSPADTGTGWTPDSSIRGIELGHINLAAWDVYLGAGNADVDLSGSHIDLYASAERLFGVAGNSITLYGYKGKADLPSSVDGQDFHRIGGFLNIYGPNTKGVLGYLTGSDDTATGQSLQNNGYFALLEHLFSDRWAAYGRYDWFKRKLQSDGSETISGPTLGVSWWAQTQVRMTLETQFLKRTGEGRESSMALEFMWAL